MLPTENNQRYHAALLFILSRNAPTEEIARQQHELEELLASGALPDNNLQTLQCYMGLETETDTSDSTKGPETHDEEKQRCL